MDGQEVARLGEIGEEEFTVAANGDIVSDAGGAEENSMCGRGQSRGIGEECGCGN